MFENEEDANASFLFYKNSFSIFCLQLVRCPFARIWPGPFSHNIHKFLAQHGKHVKTDLARICAQDAQARPSLSRPGLTEGLSIHEGADLHETQRLICKRNFQSLLIISEPSRPQKWIQYFAPEIVSKVWKLKIDPFHVKYMFRPV